MNVLLAWHKHVVLIFPKYALFKLLHEEITNVFFHSCEVQLLVCLPFKPLTDCYKTSGEHCAQHSATLLLSSIELTNGRDIVWLSVNCPYNQMYKSSTYQIGSFKEMVEIWDSNIKVSWQQIFNIKKC